MAEVLITLGIIGVVAAMTMPALMSHYKKQEASARLKKFYSTMSQAIQMSENEHGPIKDWDFPYWKDADGNYKSNAESKADTLAFFNYYLAPYIKYTGIDENPKDLIPEGAEDTSYIRVYLPDASNIRLYLGACIDMDFDVNGIKQPNEYGRDMFKFLFCSTTNNQNAVYCGVNKYFCGYGALDSGHQSREAQYNACKAKKHACTQLLMMDGWEFKPDYPWKL